MTTEVSYDVLGDFPISVHQYQAGSLVWLCGYLGVPKCHPWFGLTTDSDIRIRVHGGITFPWPEYIPDENFPHNLEGLDIWWIGFDCNHFPDQANPKSLIYVQQELKELAEQAAEAWQVAQEA